jgi:hypothetical protein
MSEHRPAGTVTQPPAFAGSAAGERIVVPHLDVPTPHGPFALRDLTLWLDPLVLSATATNHTDRPWSWASFQLAMSDPAGQPIEYDDRIDGSFYLAHIERGATRPIVSQYNERPVSLLFSPERAVASIGASFVTERSYPDPQLALELVEPVASADALYADDWITIAFELTRWELRFALRNRRGEPLQIQWPQASYRDPVGETHQVIHRGVPLAHLQRPLQPATVAPFARIEEMIYPLDRVSGGRVFHDWRLNPLLPSTRFEDYRGGCLELVLPLESGGDTRPYTFILRLTDVLP